MDLQIEADSIARHLKDLEEQLSSAQDELAILRSKIDRSHLIEQTSITLPATDRPAKRVKLDNDHDFSMVRCNLLRHGYGLATVRLSEFPEPPGSGSFRSLSSLPPRIVGDRLIACCRDRLLDSFPVIHWPSLMQWYENAYRFGSVEDLPRSRAAILYAVLAYGKLGDTQQAGLDFENSSRALLYAASEDLTTNHAVTAFLLTLYYWEIDKMNTAWTTLGFAVRVAQDLGLHRGNVISEGKGYDNSRRLWWSIYVVDRSD